MVTGSRSDSTRPRQGFGRRRIRRTVARLGRRAGVLLARRAAVATAPPAPRWTMHLSPPAPARAIATSEPRAGVRPQAPRERRRGRATPVRLPHAIHLCIHCRANPAGFWVSRAGGMTVRRPWCLFCCEGLDRHRCDIIPFDP